MAIPELPPNTSLVGQSILITGSNTGLGYDAALLALRLGASPVYITARNLSKGQAARESLLADAVVKQKNPKAKVVLYELDMATWEGVLRFADRFVSDREAAGEALDIAILNAGMAGILWEVAPTGNEMTVQVNHLSTALLSLLLLPLLEKSTTAAHTARLTIISSGQHAHPGSLKQCPPEDVNYLQTLNDRSKFEATSRYGLSKLLIIFWLRHLSARVSPDKVIINTVCPGPVKTNLTSNMPLWMKPVVWVLQNIVMRATTPDVAARTYIQAVQSIGKESHGLWWSQGTQRPYSEFVTSEEGEKLEEKVWKETVQIFKGVRPGIEKIVQ